MSIGESLLQLQEIDLNVARNKAKLADMPEIRALAEKRKMHAKLKSELTKLYAERKDLDIEVEDLKGQQQDAEDDVNIAQRRPLDTSDYRAVQDLQQELSDLAKKLDKIAHTLEEVEPKRDAAVEHEARAKAAVAKFEQEMLADAKDARAKAEAIQNDIDTDARRRAHLVDGIPSELIARYDKTLKTCRGIAVEALEGTVPSVCHMELQTSLMDELRHAGEISECPYCHRILVMPLEGEEA